MKNDDLEREFEQRWVTRGGVSALHADDAIALIRRAQEERIRILGVDGLLISPERTESPIGHIADYSTAVATDGCWSDAIHFVEERRHLGLVFEVVLGETVPFLHSPGDLDKISEVLPFLFIGSYGAAENLEYLREQGITHAVCLLEQQPESMAGLSNLCLPMSDHGDSDLGLLLAAALPFIEEARATGGRVLIFCALGVNRSAALAAGYLRIALRCSPEEALSRIAASRPFISLHEGYLSQLAQIAISA